MFDFLGCGLKPSQERRNLEPQFQRHLGAPLQDLLSRPKKEIRSQLVYLGFELARGLAPTSESDLKSCDACARAIESLHTGSLIIDDIQDASEWRRGDATLHLKYGVPVAINAGNWLYFHAFQNIREGTQDPMIRLRLFEMMEQVLREAHLGQALDLGNDISQLAPAEMIEISRASLEMKSGALMALSLMMGAIVAGSDSQKLSDLKDFGIRFGVSLQMFDDLGNVRLDRPTTKHLEDLILKRPSFVWWTLASHFPEQAPNFRAAIEALPDISKLDLFLTSTPLLQTGFSQALEFQKQALEILQTKLNPNAKLEEQISQIANKVAYAYC